MALFRSPWPLVALLLVACAQAGSLPAFERFDRRMTPTANDYPDVAALILLDRGLLTFGLDDERQVPYARLRRFRRLKVLRPPGRDQARIEVPFDPGSIVRGLIARAIQPDGTTVNIEDDDARVVEHASGVRALVLELPDVDVGTIIEHTYDLYTDDLRFIPPWQFQHSFPTVRSEYAVVVPAGFDIDLRFSQGGRFVDRVPERFETETGTRYSWSFGDLPARFAEADMPAAPLLSPRAHVLFRGMRIGARDVRGFDSWDAVVAWQRQRTPNWSKLSTATVDEARRVAGDASRDERALKILEVLARDLKSEPGPPPPLWRAPMAHPDAVLAAQRANPTTRGMLLVALLQAVGVSAVPALYAYADRDILLPDAPIARSVDGVVAVVPQARQPLVLDPNQLTVSSAVLSPRLQGSRLILAREDGAEVLRVPTSAPEDSRCEVEFELMLDESGGLSGTLDARLTGAEAGVLRERLLGARPEDYARITSGFLHQRGAALPIESVSIADLKALRRPLRLKGRLRLEGMITGESTRLFVPIGRLVGWPTIPLRQTRRSPLLLGAPRVVDLRGTLRLPDGYETDVVPPPIEHRFDDVRVRVEARSETQRRLGFIRSERWPIMVVSPAQYGRYFRFTQEVRASEEEAFSIRRPPERKLEY